MTSVETDIKMVKHRVNKMRIVAIEGLDKAGKHTATETLKNFFESRGLKVITSSAPNYDGPIGQLIYDWLRGDFEADTKTFELLQVADKQQMQTSINQWEKEGYDILIMDRYIHSVLAYGAYDNDRDWLKTLTTYLREPDAVVYLDVEPEVSMHRNGKFGDNDIYESNLDRLRCTQGEYELLFKGHKNSDTIHYVDANLPQLIASTQVLEAGGQILFDCTGEVLSKKDLWKTMTRDEYLTFKEWYGDNPEYESKAAII